MEKLIIEAKQPRALKKAVVSFLFLTLSILLCIVGMRDKKTLYWMVGFMSTMYFLISFLIYFGKTKSIKPLITITFDGIIDSTTSTIGYIPFYQIKRFIIVPYEEKEVIGIEPKNKEEYLKKLPPSMQQLARERMEKGLHPFIIPVDEAKDMSLKDIYTLLKKRLQDYSSLYD